MRNSFVLPGDRLVATYLCSAGRLFVPALWIGAGLLALPFPGSADELREAIRVVRKTLADDMVHPDTGLVLTRIRRHGDPLEDTSLYGGFYLGALTLAWEATADAATARLARKVLAGLFLNATRGPPGFVARGVTPDGKTVRGDPSVDQYTGLLYGLWEFRRSALATREEKERISRLFTDVLTRLREADYSIRTRDNDRMTRFGRLAAVMPTRSERLLSFLCSGAAITGDRAWFAEYERLRRPRLAALTSWTGYSSWVLIQTAASLRILCLEEERPGVALAYCRAAREVAAACLPELRGYTAYLEDPRPPEEKLEDREIALQAVRIPVEAATAVMLLGDDEQAQTALPHLRRLILELPPGSFTDSRPLVSLEWAYWLAVIRGLL